MAQLIVRGLEEDIKARLQRRATRNGQSMEAEARDILRNALKDDERTHRIGLGTRISDRFRGIGLKPGEEIEELRGHVLKSPFEE